MTMALSIIGMIKEGEMKMQGFVLVECYGTAATAASACIRPEPVASNPPHVLL